MKRSLMAPYKEVPGEVVEIETQRDVFVMCTARVSLVGDTIVVKTQKAFKVNDCQADNHSGVAFDNDRIKGAQLVKDGYISEESYIDSMNRWKQIMTDRIEIR